MSSVDEVFRQMQTEQNEVSMLSGEETIDSNDYCMLESDTTRKILIPEKYSIFGVESDEYAKTVKFAFPRYVNDGKLDLSEYSIRINYMTANPDTENNKDQVQAKNVHVVDDYVVFEWELSRRVTQYRGTITFIVCAVTAESNGEITTEWNTTISTSQSIEGLEVSPNENEEEQVRDLLTELLTSINTAGSTNLNQINGASQNALDEIESQKTSAISSIASAKETAVSAVQSAQSTATSAINTAKTNAVSDIEEEGQAQLDAIDTKAGQALESIPDDYTTLEGRVDELEKNRAYVIVGESTGEFITLNDSSELKTRSIKLFGKSVQVETTGAQLFNVNVCKNETDLQYKITIDDYATGKITVSMDNPEGVVAMPVNRLSDYCPTMTSGKTYYLSGKHDGSSNGDISLVDVSDTWNFGTSREITEQDLQSAVKFGFGTYSNIMIVEGSTEKPYEVYTGGEPATEPSPEYPLPITSAGNYDEDSGKYEMGINVDGANLFPIQSVSLDLSGVKVDYQPDGGYRVHGKSNFTGTGRLFLKIFDFDLIPGEYSFSQNIVGENDNKSVYFTDSLKKIADNYVNEKTIVIDEPTSNIGYIVVSTKNDIDCVIYVMLNVGDKSLPFEISEHKLSTLQLPNPLRGIPVNSGGNYTDTDGQQWICDYIDRERGKYVQCVQECVFDGSVDENWFYQQDTNTFSLNIGGEGVKNRVCICDRFFSKQGINPQNVDYLCCGFNPIPKYSGYFYFKSIGEIHFTLVSDFKKWLSNNPTTIIYQLKNPIETDLTPDQLAALNLSTYQGITNIGTDTMPQVGVDVGYIADTKTYIDNAISQAIAVMSQNE